MKIADSQLLKKIKNTIAEIDPMAVAILFGSRATGKARKDSDWDILILLNKSKISLKDEQQFRHNLYDVELETGELISTLIYSAKDWDTKLSVTPIYQDVKKFGIVL